MSGGEEDMRRDLRHFPISSQDQLGVLLNILRAFIDQFHHG